MRKEIQMRRVVVLLIAICISMILCSCSKFSIRQKNTESDNVADSETNADETGRAEAEIKTEEAEETKAEDAAITALRGTKYICMSDNGITSNDPFGQRFYIELYKNGTATYSQPLYSSYMPFPKWRVEDGKLVLDDGMMGIVNYFDIVDGNLVFRAEESSGFMFYHFVDGEVFTKQVSEDPPEMVYDKIMIPFETELTGRYGANFLIPIDGKIYRYIQSGDTYVGYEKGEQIFSFKIDDGMIKEDYKVYRPAGAENDLTLVVECYTENCDPGCYEFLLRYRSSRSAKDGDLERVKADGFVVMEDLHVTSGKEVWADFYDKVEQGIPCSVRIAKYYKYDDSKYVSDERRIEMNDYPMLFLTELIYDGFKLLTRPLHFADKDYVSYCIVGDESPERTWKYLMHYSVDAPGSASNWTTCERYVLVNDDTRTWKQIEWGSLSSTAGAYVPHDTVYTEYEWK